MKAEPLINFHNGDCLAFMRGLPDKMLFNQFRDFISYGFYVRKITLPKSKNGNTTRFEVGILRNIQCFSFYLSFIKSCVKFRIAMPVVAIELQNKIFRLNKGINRELSIDYILGNKLNFEFIKGAIGKFFKFIWIVVVLDCIHFNKSFFKGFRFIPTIHTAIFGVAVIQKGWANLKFVMTIFAGNLYFISSLIFISTINTASNCLSSPNFGNVKNTATYNTFFFSTLFFPSFLSVFMKTPFVAKLCAFHTRFCHCNSTPKASESSNTVFHNVNILLKNVTQKPVALYKWLLQNYAKPGDKILDTHGGSMSIAIAAYDLGFDLDICEIDADYFRDGVARFERHKNRWHEGMNTAISDETDYSKNMTGLFAATP